MASRWQWGLPLFTKELLEQAARRRTYLIRVIYVALLCYLAMGSLATQLLVTNALNALGQGLPVLTSLVGWEFTGIYLFLPAMACGVFTVEKERNTLALLFLTRLGPWTLITEKLLSRLFPMLMFLCSGLPVIAFTYAMGGLTSFQIFCSAWFLLLATFQVACAAVMCSALSYSTARAFLQTYFVIFLLGILPNMVVAFVPSQLLAILTEVLMFGAWSQTNPGAQLWQYGLHPYVLTQVLAPTGLFTTFVGQSGFVVAVLPAWRPAIILGIPTILSGLFCLLVARWALYRRAFITPSNPLLSFFRGLDKIFSWANRKVAFDVKLVREADTLPGNDPIAWREVSKRSLGQFRYLVRIMIPMMFPVIFVGTFMASLSANDWRSNGPNVGLTPLVIFLWVVSLVLIAVTAANTVPLERMRQTWDVLRSMPMQGRDILRQKLRGVRRLQWVCSIPVVAAIGLQAWWRYQLLVTGLTNQQPGVRFPDDHYLWWEYVFGAVLSVWIYSEMVKWTALWCGLMIRNSMRAILTSVPAVLILSGGPTLIVFVGLMSVFVQYDRILYDEQTMTFIRSIVMTVPVAFVIFNETMDLRAISQLPLVPALINLCWQGTILFLLRRHILNRAEWYLGRINGRAGNVVRGNQSGDAAADMNEGSRLAVSPVVGAAS